MPRIPVELDRAKLTPAERVQLDTRGWRDRRPLETPICSSKARPFDYDNDFDRGTIDWFPGWKNYSFHKVRIPPGTTIRDSNFAQIVPRTVAITIIGSPGTVTFIDCNLIDVRLNPMWTLIDCNTVQSWLITGTDPETGEPTEERQWIARHEDDLPVTLPTPANALTKRSF